jgi:hypothetical protein
LKVIVFGVVGIVLVSATTALVSREYEPRKPTTTTTGNVRPESPVFDIDTEDDGNEDKDNEGEQENINVLHLLYTIAQATPFLLEINAGSITFRRVRASRDFV